ncbi:MAG: hypothetical protein AMXMBFR64_21680 [Myxococcales bacterium]
MRPAFRLGCALGVLGALSPFTQDAQAMTDTASSCPTTPLVTRFSVSRTWPAEGGTLPANRPVLIELSAPPRVPETPDQPVTVVAPKAFELSGGAIFGVTSSRSDYGTVRYLPGPMAEWAPTEWDASFERHMMVQLNVYELTPDGSSKLGQLVPGQAYTFKMLVGASDDDPSAFEEWELHFTAGDPAPAAADPVTGPYHSMAADSGCEEIHLDCTSAPDCSATCAQVGNLQRVRHTLDVDGGNVPLSADDPWLLDLQLSDYGFTFRQLRFPGDDPATVGAIIDTFQSATDKGVTVCAKVTISVPGGGSVTSDEACDTAEGVPDFCTGGVVPPQDAGATDGGHTPQDAGPTDAGAHDTGAAGPKDSGGAAPDAGGGGADTGGSPVPYDALGGDISGDGLGGLFGGAGVNLPVSDDGCGCNQAARRAGSPSSNGWPTALAAVALWFALRRRSDA